MIFDPGEREIAWSSSNLRLYLLAVFSETPARRAISAYDKPWCVIGRHRSTSSTTHQHNGWR